MALMDGTVRQARYKAFIHSVHSLLLAKHNLLDNSLFSDRHLYGNGSIRSAFQSLHVPLLIRIPTPVAFTVFLKSLTLGYNQT